MFWWYDTIIFTLAIFLELCSLSHILLASIANETSIHFTNKNAYDFCKASKSITADISQTRAHVSSLFLPPSTEVRMHPFQTQRTNITRDFEHCTATGCCSKISWEKVWKFQLLGFPCHPVPTAFSRKIGTARSRWQSEDGTKSISIAPQGSNSHYALVAPNI